MLREVKIVFAIHLCSRAKAMNKIATSPLMIKTVQRVAKLNVEMRFLYTATLMIFINT